MNKWIKFKKKTKKKPNRKQQKKIVFNNQKEIYDHEGNCGTKRENEN